MWLGNNFHKNGKYSEFNNLCNQIVYGLSLENFPKNAPHGRKLKLDQWDRSIV